MPKRKRKEAGEGALPRTVRRPKTAAMPKRKRKEAGEGAQGETPNGVDPRKKGESKNGGAVRESGKEEQKEGFFHLGDPTFVDLGNGRVRCVESGHELLAKDKEAYGRSKPCRLALIDAAVARQMPLLNMFEPHPTSKSQLVCKLTRDEVNKTEDHIWKHLCGKKFQTVFSLFRFALV
ncbi:uncharacterized protein LOC141824319 [Curcuma longa]|uniref:uncharacterized protein LOC141824319 n=1 Tax=Curcuma longa TaxID=136217 RepID=UPI003D9E6110